MLYSAYDAGLRGRPTFAYLAEYERQQWLDAAQIRDLQTAKLRALLAHAAQNVPHFTSVFRSLGMAAADIRGPEDLTALPIMTKQEVRRDYKGFVSAAYAGTNIGKATGGTTGDPFQFECNPDSEYRRLAVMWRGYGWAGATPGCNSAYLWSWPYAGKQGWRLLKEKAYQGFLGRTYFSVFDLTDARMATIAARLQKLRPEVLVCYVSGGVTLAQWLLQNDVHLPALKAVITGAEPLHAAQRDIIQQAFGAPVFNTYGSRETMLMAQECPQHNGLHINADHLILETVDEQGNPVCGKPGRVLVTDLHNYGMPFIRYANGDLASLETRRCECGRALPLLSHIDGRETDVVHLQNGRTIVGLYFVHTLKDYPQIQYFQVVQENLNEIIIRIVAMPGQTLGPLLALADRMRRDLDNHVRIVFEPVTQIPLTASGKRRIIVSTLAPSDVKR